MNFLVLTLSSEHRRCYTFPVNKVYFVKLVAALSFVGVAGCAGNGVRLSKTDGYPEAEKLGIPQAQWGVSRIESRSGGTSRCIPTSTIAVLVTGEVYCRSRVAKEHECPEPYLYSGKISPARAQALFDQARAEFDPEKGAQEACAGAFGTFTIYDREQQRRYSLDTACTQEEPMQQSKAALDQIWKEQCEARQD